MSKRGWPVSQSARQLGLGLSISAALFVQGCAQSPLQRQAFVPAIVDSAKLIRFGDEAYGQARFDQAQRAYEDLIEANPQSFVAWFKLGNTHLRQGQSEQAERAYLEALKITPDDPKAWYNLATARLMNAKGALRGAAQNLPLQDPARRLAVQRLKVLDDLIFKTLEQTSTSTEANTSTDEVDPLTATTDGV